MKKINLEIDNKMPVYKYRSFKEAETALWNFNPDKAYYNKIAFLLRTGSAFLRPGYKPGLQKFRSIEEANKSQELEIKEHSKKTSKSQRT